jgi:hypothetical protein
MAGSSVGDEWQHQDRWMSVERLRVDNAKLRARNMGHESKLRQLATAVAAIERETERVLARCHPSQVASDRIHRLEQERELLIRRHHDLRERALQSSSSSSSSSAAAAAIAAAAAATSEPEEDWSERPSLLLLLDLLLGREK